MAAWIWVLIPLAAIMLGFYTEWLKFKSKQEKLGTSAHELETTVQRLEKALEASETEREGVERRLQNLEAIVTSEAWDTLHDKAPSHTPLLEELPSEPSEAAPTQQAERLARRVRG